MAGVPVVDLLLSPIAHLTRTRRGANATCTAWTASLTPSATTAGRRATRTITSSKVAEIDKALDISGVQTYVINSARVLFLNEWPLPRSSTGKGVFICAKSAHRVCSTLCASALSVVRFKTSIWMVDLKLSLKLFLKVCPGLSGVLTKDGLLRP
ncbi:hypothetical protein NL676_031145 [Syzygium grande]|nr:hypothetical protein NL676_031145 [Syzygium grande]